MSSPDLYCAYARHSDRNQETSVDQQIEEFRKFAALNNLTLYEPVFEDRAKSGTTDAGRGGIDDLMEFLARRPRPVRGVLLWASSRIARNVDDSAFYKASIRRMGYKIVYLGDELLNIEGPERHILESFIEYKDAKYSLDLGRDVIRGLRKAITDGTVIGRAPKGYRLVQDPASKKNRLELDPDTSAMVLEAWDMRAAGHTLTDIHEALRLFPFHGSYSYMFRNKIYLGILEWCGEDFPNFCPALVAPDTWAKVQAVNQRIVHPRRSRSKFLLSGSVYCGNCQKNMGTRSFDANGRHYSYYYCNKYKGGCGAVYVRTEALEQIAITKLGETFTPDKIGPLYARALKKRNARGGPSARNESQLKAKLADANKAIDNLTKAVEQGAAFQSIAQALREREAERAALQKKLATLPPAPVAKQVSIPALCKEVQRILITGDDADRRVLVRSAIARVDVFLDRGPKIHINPIVL